MNSLKPVFYIYLPLILYSIGCSSPKQSTIITGNKEVLKNSSDIFYISGDSIFYTYRSNIAETLDTIKIYPSHFKLFFLKKTTSFERFGSTDFIFYFDKNQVIAIKIGTLNEIIESDSLILPSRERLKKIIEQDFYMTTKGVKEDLQKIPFKANRKHMILKKGKAYILLYNVINSEIDLFLSSAKSFEFL